MLPKLSQPILEIDVPSMGVKKNFRPMLVKEEKVLLMAKENDDPDAPLKAIKQVVRNCSLDELDVDKIAVFDLEWLFLRLRASSVGNVIDLEYVDHEDDKTYKVPIDLNKVAMPKIDGKDRAILIKDNVSLLLRYPPASIYGETVSDTGAIFACVEAIVQDGVVTPMTSTPEEFEAWFEDLPIDASARIDAFFKSLPTMQLEVSYKNSKGSERKIEFKTLSDFFDWR